MLKFTFLSENKTQRVACLAEFGLSMIIEADGKTILFDTGCSELFAENAKRIGVDLDAVDCCVISHGHFDHTQGVPRFCRENSHAPVYIHKDSLYPTFGTTDGELNDYNCGVIWTDGQKAEIADRLVFTDGPLWLTDNIVISGTIPDVPGFKPIEDFFRKLPEGLVPDTLSHEQFLAVREEGKGVFLFSGCSHKGIVAAVEYAKKLFPGERIYAIVAGMHMMAADRGTVLRVIARLKEEDPEIVMPMHCTGGNALAIFKEEFGDRCELACCGGSYEY